MAKINIQMIDDQHDCDTCGMSYAQGARVVIDDEVALVLEPHAACFDGDHYDDAEIFKRVLIHLGHEVEVTQ